jgi:hypothetical protein
MWNGADCTHTLDDESLLAQCRQARSRQSGWLPPQDGAAQGRLLAESGADSTITGQARGPTCCAAALAAPYKQLANDLMNGYLSLGSHRLNQILKLLRIITCSFAPVSFGVGVYGKNLRVMAELAFPHGGFIVIGVMATRAVALLLLRQRKWCSEGRSSGFALIIIRCVHQRIENLEYVHPREALIPPRHVFEKLEIDVVIDGPSNAPYLPGAQ